MEFHVLGALRVIRDGEPVPIGAARKPRLLLAALLTRAGQTVSTDWLVDTLWTGHPPASARRNVHQYVHQLRDILGTDRLWSRPGGYWVAASADLDAVRFRRLAADGSTALDAQDPAVASRTLRSALDLWCGDAYEEFVDCRPVADEAARLEELRLVTLERWTAAELTLGQHAAVVSVLVDLVRAHPYRERLHALLMRALYGAGRQAEALQAYRDIHALLREQLGIEPGPELQRLHEQMLRADADLAPPADDRPTSVATIAGVRPSGSLPVPRELPADAAGFTGRAAALAELDRISPSGDETYPPMTVTAITGTPGVGKTALAVHWAHRAADRFPDGQLYLNLRGYGQGAPLRPLEALTALLGALGVPPDQVPLDVARAAARYRSLCACRRLLVLLDDAASAEQVRSLLPASSGCLVLVTSSCRPPVWKSG